MGFNSAFKGLNVAEFAPVNTKSDDGLMGNVQT